MRSAQTIKTNIHSAIAEVALRRHPSRIYCNHVLPDKEVKTVLNRVSVGREDDPNLEIVRRIFAASKDYFSRHIMMMMNLRSKSTPIQRKVSLLRLLCSARMLCATT